MLSYMCQGCFGHRKQDSHSQIQVNVCTWKDSRWAGKVQVAKKCRITSRLNLKASSKLPCLLWSQGWASPSFKHKILSCSLPHPISKYPITMMHRCCPGLAVASASTAHPRALCTLLFLCSSPFIFTSYSLCLFLFPTKCSCCVTWLLQQRTSRDSG